MYLLLSSALRALMIAPRLGLGGEIPSRLWAVMMVAFTSYGGVVVTALLVKVAL